MHVLLNHPPVQMVLYDFCGIENIAEVIQFIKIERRTAFSTISLNNKIDVFLLEHLFVFNHSCVYNLPSFR